MNLQAERKLDKVFREMPDIGVIRVLDEAKKLGYQNGDPDWVNLGQGEPEVGKLKGGPSRIKVFNIVENDNRYGETNGIYNLRIAIAAHYNRLYRQNKSSKYIAENVSIAMGGRLALTRIFTALGSIRLGYKVPEYPAYEDMLNYQIDKITPVRIKTRKANNYAIPSNELKQKIKVNILDALLLSNPCNPTGHVIEGEELNTYISIVREEKISLIIDEFYSQFIFRNGKAANKPVSIAKHIEDVNSDNVIIVDGLTKAFRYPGWRLAWVLGPENIITDLGRVASGLDGGPSVPIQKAAIQLFEPKRVDLEMKILRDVFCRKQLLTINSLNENGIQCSKDINGTFYVWADISQLPLQINTSDNFFTEALKRKVITVPGYMFDIQPGRLKKASEFNQYVRISFGPEEGNLRMGLERITQLIKSYG